MTLTLEQISAHIEIRQCLARYCRGVDRRDIKLLKSVYHPDATDNHGTFNGKAHDFAEYLMNEMKDSPGFGTHQVTITYIKLHGADSADTESYYLAHHPLIDAKTGERQLLHTGGRYIDHFERRNGEWKIARRLCTIDWSRRHLPGETWEIQSQFVKVGAVGEDPSYTQFDLG